MPFGNNADVNRDRTLAVVSSAQLGAGLLGMVVAIRRRRAYDFLFLHGRSDRVARDAVLMGTAYSAPAIMLAAQAAAILQLLRSATTPADLVLGALGAAMVPGYLGETSVRQRLHPSNYDAVETPLVLIGVSLAATMAVLGLHTRHRRS